MKLPDGPQTLPFLQTVQWIARPLEFLDGCFQNYGDIFTLKWKNVSQVFISNPQALQELFTAAPDTFGSIPGNGPSAILLGKNSSLWSDHERHQRQRRLLAPAFHGECMRSYGHLICETTKQAMSHLIPGKPFSIHSFSQNISLQIILSTVFGLHPGKRSEEFKQLYTSLLEYAIGSPLISSLLFFNFLQRDLGPQSPWGRFMRKKQQMDELIYAEILQRREHPDPSREDILSLLLRAGDEVAQPMTDVELRDELMTLLFAGHESTASAIAWALYWIDQSPKVQNYLEKELSSLDPDPDPSVIAQLPYLTAICQETLRIYPPGLVAIARILKSPLNLLGYQFEPNTLLIPCIYLVHQREELYPEPKLFKPERFLERQFSPYEYLPFGGGHRHCIGIAFAQYEMKLVLVSILLHFRLASINKRLFKPIRRGAAMGPPANMRMMATNRL